MAGFIIIDKPSGPTSHDIVDAIRRLTGEKRVGHAGTLDPFASGVLVVGVGREATREFSKLTGLDKRYRAILRLGAVSDTDDRTGRITNGPHTTYHGPHTMDHGPDGFVHGPWSIVHSAVHPAVHSALKKFIGKIEQVPPMYSAKKIGGKKLYELARAGKIVDRKPAQVEIYSIDLVEAKPQPNSFVVDIHCSSGTYIRSLARDIGEALGCGAYAEELRRTAVGPFMIEEAVVLEGLNIRNIADKIIPIGAILSTVATRKIPC